MELRKVMVKTLSKIQFEEEIQTLKERTPIASQVKFLYPEFMASLPIDICVVMDLSLDGKNLGKVRDINITFKCLRDVYFLFYPPPSIWTFLKKKKTIKCRIYDKI